MNPQEIIQKYDLDIDDFLRKAELISNRYGEIEGVAASMRRVDPFKQVNASATLANQTIGQGVQVYQKVGTAIQAYRRENELLRQTIAEIQQTQKEMVSAARYEELGRKLEAIQTRMAALNKPLKEADTLWDKLKAKFSQGLNAKITVQQTDAPATSGTARGADGKFLPGSGSGNGSGSGGNQAGGFIRGLFGEDRSIGGTIAQLTSVVGVSFGVAEAMKLAVTESAKFGKALSELSALTGVTGKDLEFLADSAVDLETKTGIAATDIVEGFKLVGGIKPELLGNKEALAQVTEEVIALSQASGISLQEAATSAVGALNQFGEGADQAGRFVNVLAAGAKLGASEVNDTAEALKSSGTAIKAAGLSFEQGNAVIQSLAGVMIKGSEAGTGLRNVLLKLETDADKNLRPSIVGLDKALENAAKKYDTTTELTKVFGVENIVAARRILDTRTEISKLTQDLTGTDTAYEQQHTNLNNLSTDLSKAGTATVGFFRDLGQSQDGFLRKIVQGYTGLLSFLTNSKSSFTAFFASVFDRQDGGIGVAFQKAAAQYQANNTARAAQARITGIKTAANQSVADDTKALTDLYEKQGETLPKAQRAAAEKVAKARDEEYEQVVANHQKLRKEFEKADAAERARLGKNEFEQSRQRILAAKTAKQAADGNLDRIKKAAAEQAAALKTALGEDPSEEEKKKGKALEKAREDSNKLLLSAQEDYLKEYKKLEDEFGKDRLDALNKDSEEYVKRKAELDRQQIEAERLHFEKILQLAASSETRINKLTGQREVVPNTSVKLPANIAAGFDARTAAVTAEENRKLEEARFQARIRQLGINRQFDELEVEEVRHKWEEIIREELKGFTGSADARKAKEKELRDKQDRDVERTLIQQVINQTRQQESVSLTFVDSKQVDSDLALQQRAKDRFLNIEQEKERMRLTIRVNSGKKLLAYLEQQGGKENAELIVQTKAAINAAEKGLESLDKLSKFAGLDGAGFFAKLFNIPDKNVDQFRSALLTIGNAITEVTQQQIQASEERIRAIESEISAKEEQVKTEEERDKQGYANNLALRQAELEDLKRQKADEQRVRANAVRQQQVLDLASSTSTNIATTADAIATAVKAMKSTAGIPFVGVLLAIAAAASIFATIATFRAKAQALTAPIQLRKGGPGRTWGRLRGPSHEQGGIRGTGAFSDIEVEGREYITNAESSERYDKTLEALNLNNPQLALRSLIREGGFGLPELIVQQLLGADFGKHAVTADYTRLESLLGEHGELLRSLVGNTQRVSQYVGLPGGGVLEITPEGKRIIRT